MGWCFSVKDNLALDKWHLKGYKNSMIKSFSNKRLEKFFDEGVKKGIATNHINKIDDILERLEAASVIEDMNFPGSNLHLLEPKKKGRWAVKVSGNWRITFRFKDGDAYEVNYEDYH